MSPLATVGIRTPATSRERRGLGEGAGRRGPSHGGSWVRARSAPSHIWTTPPPPKSGRSPPPRPHLGTTPNPFQPLQAPHNIWAAVVAGGGCAIRQHPSSIPPPRQLQLLSAPILCPRSSLGHITPPKNKKQQPQTSGW